MYTPYRLLATTIDYLLPYSNDEYELNINFWKAKAYKQWCIYDPYFTIVHISSSDNIFNISYDDFIFFNFVYGCKSPIIQNHILQIKCNKYKIIYTLNNTITYTKS